ncbi:MAG: hypothetical protein L6R38_007655 [Xanthoria sp. 2 TBL-2021]|nr:MAG: hypothetical protein L6R38_007655 [Xanthoria sp. 2 TBL-2021]
MHQLHRPPPVTASPANSAKTNPTRTNNPREGGSSNSRPSSGRGTSNEQAIDMGEGSDALMRGQDDADPGRDGVQKLNQVVQNYFTKAAHIILHSRVSLPPAYHKGTDTKRVNKWFNTELDETEVTRDDLKMWKTCNSTINRPPVMVIEIYIDTKELTSNQSLAILDDQGQRWDVQEALASSPGSSGDSKRGQSRPEVVLERWQIQLGEPSKELSKDLPVILPRVYKNSIVLFRSLFAFAKLLPAWNLAKKNLKSRSPSQSPKLKYRVIEGSRFHRSSTIDPLTLRLFDASSTKGKQVDEVVEHYAFEPIESPAGPFSIQVTYRLQCDFRVDDAETLLSSHFMGMDEQFFEPSLGRKGGSGRLEKQRLAQGTEAGSLPQYRRGPVERPDPSQAYGSMSTFHQPGPVTGSSPLSALRAARDRASQSPPEAPQPRPPPGPRLSQGSRSSLRSSDGAPAVGRRPSVSFMPFKTPSLSASPSQGEQIGASLPRGSLGRNSALGSLTEARIPSSLGLQGTTPSRASPSIPDQAPLSSMSGSPKPSISRYSSSFGHRKAKSSVGGGSKTEEDNNSSGKASLTSSKPGSGILAEGGGASSGSIPTDDDNISDFLKMLDQRKDLRSFRRASDQSGAEASTRRTNAALERFQRMRDSNAALSESISSSLLLHRSSSSSSRQLSSVPPMVAGTSISTSSSLGKPISPHTPHTPAIPSRLSANSIIEYPHRRPSSDGRLEEVPDTEEPSREDTYWDPSTGAIDIPTSPRPFQPSYRRSSSVAQQPRALPLQDDFPFGMRSASVDGANDRPQLSLSALLQLQEDAASANPDDLPAERPFRPLPAPVDGSGGSPVMRQQSNEENTIDQAGYRQGSYRPRIGQRGADSGRLYTPPHGSSISSIDRVSAGSGSSDQYPGSSRGGGGGRYSFSRPNTHTFEEEEPLLFAMSDFNNPNSRHESTEGINDNGKERRREGGKRSAAEPQRGQGQGRGEA